MATRGKFPSERITVVIPNYLDEYIKKQQAMIILKRVKLKEKGSISYSRIINQDLEKAFESKIDEKLKKAYSKKQRDRA